MTIEYDIKTDHQAAEHERLAAGQEGCGCPDCQQFYKTLDLSRYGKRVIHSQDCVIITEGRAGAVKWQQYHQDDVSTPPVKGQDKKQRVKKQNRG